MKQRLGVVILCLAFGLWCAGTASAQTQQQNVQITNGPTVQNVAADSANITWSTNVPAGSTVRYGTDPNKLDRRAQESWGGTNHSVQVKGLQPDTTYYYQVVSGQGLGTGSGMMGAVQSFKTAASGAAASTSTTPAPATSNPPAASATQNNESNISIVAGPIARQVKDTSAHIWWQTNSPSSTILMYGTDANNISQKSEKPWGKDSHSVQLTGLNPGTTYYFRVVTSDGRELEKGSFQTANSQQAQQQFQIIHGPAVEKLGPDSVVVAWTTSAPSSSIVKYGTDPNNLSQTAQAEWGQQTHRVTVNNLQPNTKYYFQVQSGQAQGTGQEMSSATFPLTTEAPGAQARVFNTR